LPAVRLAAVGLDEGQRVATPTEPDDLAAVHRPLDGVVAADRGQLAPRRHAAEPGQRRHWIHRTSVPPSKLPIARRPQVARLTGKLAAPARHPAANPARRIPIACSSGAIGWGICRSPRCPTTSPSSSLDPTTA